MEHKELLRLSRNALESHFLGKDITIPEKIKDNYSELGACFVTITKNNDLKGCIGSLEAHQPLYENIIQNTINAAFYDYRFPSLEEEELNQIKIEISLISKPLNLGIGKKVFKKIKKNMGIILNLKGHTSTFLPQVWEQIPDKTVFLEELSRKAGLDKDAWQEAELLFYEAEKFKEA